MASLWASVHDDTDMDAALVEPFLNVTLAEWETVREPQGRADDVEENTVAVGFPISLSSPASRHEVTSTPWG